MTSAQLLRWGGQISILGAALIFASQLVGPFLSNDPSTIAATGVRSLRLSLAGADRTDLVATPAGGMLLLGGSVSFATFTIGWFVFAVATLRARVFPRWMAVLLMAGALLAFGQGSPPFGALLALAVGALGVASLRLGRASAADLTASGPPAAQAGTARDAGAPGRDGTSANVVRHGLLRPDHAGSGLSRDLVAA